MSGRHSGKILCLFLLALACMTGGINPSVGADAGFADVTDQENSQTERAGERDFGRAPGIRHLEPKPNASMGIIFTRPDYDIPTWEWVESLNVKWIRRQVPWWSIQPGTGPFDPGSTAPDLEFQVDLALSMGSYVVPLVKSQHAEFTDYIPEVHTDAKSFPPHDMGLWSQAYGYSRSYYDFIFGLVSYYGERIPAIVIENEAHLLNMWSGDLDQYLKLLMTARLAADRANPNLLVIDSGPASGALGDAMVQDIFEGRFHVPRDPEPGSESIYRVDCDETSATTGPELALEIINEFKSQFAGFEGYETTSDLADFLYLPRIQRNYLFITDFISRVGDNIDGMNIHYYEDWWNFGLLREWIDFRFGLAGRSTPEIWCMEGGIRRKEPYDKWGAEHSSDMIKQMMHMMTTGMEAYVWFPRDGGHRNQVGFLNDGENSEDPPRMAATTFAFLNQAISEQGYNTFELLPLPGHPNVRRYRASLSNRALPVLEVLWWDDGSHGEGSEETELAPPQGARMLFEYDYTGKTRLGDIGGASPIRQLQITERARIFEFWP